MTKEKKLRLPDLGHVLKLSTTTGKITLAGEPITKNEVENLKSEVRTWREFRLRKVFYETLKQQAFEKAMSGTEINDRDEELLRLMLGKAILHVIGVQENIEKIIEKL